MKLHRLLIAFCVLCIACKKDIKEQEGTLQITFKNVVNGAALKLNTTNYTNAAGETFTISRFRYFISNIALIKMDNSELKLPAAYYLINEADSASKTIDIPAPGGEYRGITFMVGVDSIRNVSGAQTGALDPVSGMFWSWNSGYIMAQLEGTSPVSTAANNALTFHIGGFQGQYSALQTIPLISPISLSVSEIRHPQITINADAYAWFNQPNLVRFQTISTIHVPGEDAWKIATNYRNMFRITDVTDL
ncbi:hypothetical protein GFS24_17980 [Chitinophaga sp. SYP-B3965]|uniref:MbnP family protein n=1 Tax=Chitinophaga sp. SYP-B3965 TaxID=2663120 RepID=UPI001299C51B|nr:MbnP family protein [Chitinophaga sp. SYP-B3965]MRG47017.1 hypothetical protein [Chitinophaga sp. SYP-B3965]